MELEVLTDFPLKITDTALAQFTTALAEEVPASDAIRIGVKGGGCSGFTYILEFIKNEDIDPEDDKIYEIGLLKFVIDIFSVEYLKNTTINYHTSLRESGFKFISGNPNSKLCGCGASFSG